MSVNAVSMSDCSVLNFGARPNSFEDDSEAFEKAALTGRSIYVPAGIYCVSRPISLVNQNIIGEGIFATQIISTCLDPSQAIIYAGRSCVISDLTVAYKEGLVTGEEQEGQRVGINTADINYNYPLQRGSTIRNVQIHETGTAIYNHSVEKTQDGCSTFSVLYESLEISNFSYRGIDFSSDCRTGSIFNNLYIYSNKPHVDEMLHFSGEDSELTLNQVNVELTRCKTAIRLEKVRGLEASTIHMQNITLTEPDSGFLEMQNSNAHIGVLSIYYCAIDQNNISLIRIGDALYDIGRTWTQFSPNTMNRLHIDNLHVKGLNDPTNPDITTYRGIADYADRGFFFFYRPEQSKGDFFVSVDQYSWYTFQKDIDVYEKIPRDPEKRIVFKKLGELPEGGPTESRPMERLCPFISRYYDTDLKKQLIWDGERWVPTGL